MDEVTVTMTEKLSSLITNLGTIGTGIFDQVGTVSSTIQEDPLMLLTVGFLFVGGAIGIFGRLLSRN